MYLSALQKYILLECYAKKGRLNRKKLADFYASKNKKPQDKLMTKIITRSIDRLIDRELVIGFGEKTAHKWFLSEIKLTVKGKRVGRKLLGEQGRLPFRAGRRY